ncbi:MAG: RNA-binding protein [Crocinitomicaceae bacterium]|nr:RNA-binding protein [Crocinitomicaceae bacterium]
MVNIFIANLDWSITSEDLKTTFSSFGEVSYAHVVFEKDTKRSRGYGYVEMEDPSAAIAAIGALNGIEINGRAIDVKIASPKTNRPKKENKPQENKPFKKKPFGQNRGGGQGGFNRERREGGYNNRRSGGEGYNNQRSNEDYNNERSNRYNNDNSSSERTMRPRKRMHEGGDDNKGYEKVERFTKRIDDNKE